MVYQTILIDDEAPARIRLRELLKDHTSLVSIVDEATNGIEAVSKINELVPDLIFLDIQMPGKDGFEVLQCLSYVPNIIFCTAYDKYAIQAFETNSIGYLLKPVKAESLAKALIKLQNFGVKTSRSEISQLVNEILQQKQLVQPTSFPVKVGDRIVFIKLEDISYFTASSKYVEIHTRQGKHYDLDQSLSYLEGKLPPNFLRIHRATIINVNLIKEVRKYMASKYSIKLDDIHQTSIVSGRNYLEAIRQVIQV